MQVSSEHQVQLYVAAKLLVVTAADCCTLLSNSDCCRTVGTVGHLSELSDCRTLRLTVYDSDHTLCLSDLLSELSDSCRTPVRLSDCRNRLSDCRTTVGLLSEFTVGLSDRGSAIIWTASDSLGQWRTVSDSTGQSRTAPDSAGQHRTVPDSTGQYRTVPDMKSDRTGQ